MRPNALRVCFLLAVFLISSSQAFAGRNWNVGDADLPAQLKGLNQDQLNMINKVKELNPAEDKFNPALLQLFLNAQQQATVVRTNEGTTVLPTPNPNLMNDVGGVPTGTGLGPAASDGPVDYPGVPTGDRRPSTEQTGESQGDDSNLFSGPFPTQEEWDEFWDWFSGSGGMFGDCVGADCYPHIGYPGYPLGGPPIGSWVHHDPSRTSNRFRDDASLISDINNGNIQGVETTLGSTLGQEVRHDPRGKGF